MKPISKLSPRRKGENFFDPGANVAQVIDKVNEVIDVVNKMGQTSEEESSYEKAAREHVAECEIGCRLTSTVGTPGVNGECLIENPAANFTDTGLCLCGQLIAKPQERSPLNCARCGKYIGLLAGDLCGECFESNNSYITPNSSTVPAKPQEEPYGQRDHVHCPEKDSPCGVKGKHPCCLCGKEPQEEPKGCYCRPDSRCFPCEERMREVRGEKESEPN
jgi:hypothetical protein